MQLQKDVIHGTWDYPFQVHRTQLQDGLHLYPHVHEEAELTVITKGQGTFCINGRDYQVKAGEALFVPSNSIHLATADTNEPAAFFSIVFSPACFCQSKSNRIYTKYVEPLYNRKIQFVEHISQSFEWCSDILNTAKEIDALYSDNDTELLCQSLLLKIWHILFSHGITIPENAHSDIRNSRLKESIDYIRENYPQKITVKNLADIANMSEGHFSRTFKEYMKISPMDYLIEIRLFESAKLLTKSDAPISDIALSCGFNDFSYFGKKFKDRFSVSPRDYRKKA